MLEGCVVSMDGRTITKGFKPCCCVGNGRRIRFFNDI